MVNFLGIIKREAKEDYCATATIDGYSTAKTILGVIRDIQRAIAKNTDNEIANCSNWYNCKNKDEAQELLLNACDSCGGYYLEIEEVSGASSYNEDLGEMEYKEGNYYFCTRIVL